MVDMKQGMAKKCNPGAMFYPGSCSAATAHGQELHSCAIPDVKFMMAILAPTRILGDAKQSSLIQCDLLTSSKKSKIGTDLYARPKLSIPLQLPKLETPPSSVLH